MTTSIAVEGPTMEAINGVLQDSTLQAALGGRLYDSLPQDTPRPCSTFHLGKQNVGGMGAARGPFELTLRIYTFSDLGSLSEAQTIDGIIQNLLADATITPTGFKQAGTIVYEQTLTFDDSELNGVKVHEVVSEFTLWVELS